MIVSIVALYPDYVDIQSEFAVFQWAAIPKHVDMKTKAYVGQSSKMSLNLSTSYFKYKST